MVSHQDFRQLAVAVLDRVHHLGVLPIGRLAAEAGQGELTAVHAHPVIAIVTQQPDQAGVTAALTIQ